MSDERPTAKRIQHGVETAAVRCLSAVLRLVPRRAALGVGAAIGWLGWGLGIRRRRVLANLEIAFPELPPSERRRIARDAAANFGRTIAEFLRFPGADRRRVADLVELHGHEELLRLRDAGRSAILVTAHLGAWALYVTALAAAGLRAALLVGRQANPDVDRFILGLPGGAVDFISKAKSSPRHVLRAIREGRLVVMVADHYSSDQKVRAPFLGRPAYTLPLPGALVERHGLPVYRMVGRRIEGGRHRVEIEPVPIEEVAGPDAGAERKTEEDRETLRQRAAERINEALGEAVRAVPEQYFWYHHRWKERVR